MKLNDKVLRQKIKEKTETANLIRTVFLCEKVDLVKYSQTEYVKLSDVLALLDQREQELRKKHATAKRKEREAYDRGDGEWETIWSTYGEVIEEFLGIKKSVEG